MYLLASTKKIKGSVNNFLIRFNLNTVNYQSHNRYNFITRTKKTKNKK